MIEKHKSYQKSIWGQWWVPVRKWFYPAWLVYETSLRFYDYTKGVHQYFTERQCDIAVHIGRTGAQVLNTFCSTVTFAGCTAFLTIPACFVLYHFFKADNLTATNLENKLKRLF